jgi:hypothetical protein
MKVTGATTLFLLFATAEAFTSKPFAMNRPQTTLSMAEASTEAGKKIGKADVRKAVEKITSDNFSSTLAEIEPFLLKEAGISFHTKVLRKIGHQAKSVGAEMPANYAKEAKATAKRRGKQDAFVKGKIEEAASAAAAEAEAAEEAAAAPAEEVAEDEPVVA